MRFKKDSMYSHPVLEQGAEMPSYRDGDIKFGLKVDTKKTVDGSSNFICTFNAVVTEPTIASLIEQGKARMGVSIVCRETLTMVAVNMVENEYVHAIAAGDVIGKTEFTLFVVANEDIKGFTSDNFVEFFEGEYDVEEGEILAFSQPYIIHMDRDSFKPLKTIISLKINPEMACREWDVDLSGDKINILLDEDSYASVQMARGLDDPKIKALLVSGLYEKGIGNAVLELQKNREIDLRWARVISNKIEISDDIDLNDEAHLVAQRLLKNPMGEFSKALLNVEGDYL